MMKKQLFLLLTAVLMCLPMFAGPKNKAKKDTEHFRYELECAGNGTQGTYLIKVWSYSKNKNVATEQCKKNAVHGVIFKGFTGGEGCVGQRALVSRAGAEVEYKEYFDLFFSDKGEYYKYVSVTSSASEIIKVGKEYKVGMIVSIQKDELRKALEQAGVVRGLNSGF
ncbi:MAG: hypothetical protein K5660_07715 [Paludibacteraceae bacterium]|nr:hypothetical protein [Paludibacteraceae bacterium]